MINDFIEILKPYARRYIKCVFNMTDYFCLNESIKMLNLSCQPDREYTLDVIIDLFRNHFKIQKDFYLTVEFKTIDLHQWEFGFIFVYGTQTFSNKKIFTFKLKDFEE